MSNPIINPCRLCGLSTKAAFQINILGRYAVQFWRCEGCHSLQSDVPHWLNEAYQSAIASNDTGAVNRNLITHAAIYMANKILRVNGALLDFGGGGGMLCRLLRDSGFDAYIYDRYAEPLYAQAYSLPESSIKTKSWALLSAIEVFEHCPAPAIDLEVVFSLKPSFLFATTILYDGEGPDWFYLTPSSGQHVFLYSKKGMHWLAASKGYYYYGFGMFHIFAAKEISGTQQRMLSWAFSRLGLRLSRIILAAIQSGKYADLDSRNISASVPSQ